MTASQIWKPSEVTRSPHGPVWSIHNQAGQLWYSSTCYRSAVERRTQMVLDYCRRVDGWGRDT